MRICSIGAGRIGRLHGALVSARPEDRIIVVDIDPGRAAEIAAAIGGRVAPTAEHAIDGSAAGLSRSEHRPVRAPGRVEGAWRQIAMEVTPEEMGTKTSDMRVNRNGRWRGPRPTHGWTEEEAA
jgi:threonine dehydrogenase-like Zn-dependent dehydrogenase